MDPKCIYAESTNGQVVVIHTVTVFYVFIYISLISEVWKMQQYQFDRIATHMGREFGKMSHGDEQKYAMVMMPMEGNALIIHRQYHSSNSRCLRNAINLVLFHIKEKCTGDTYDVENFRDEDTARLEHALLMAFDPYTNTEVKAALWEQFGTDDPSEKELRDYYKVPVMCLIRIRDSIDLWEKNMGSNGYFEFIESQMGRLIKGQKMNYAVMLPDKYL